MRFRHHSSRASPLQQQQLFQSKKHRFFNTEQPKQPTNNQPINHPTSQQNQPPLRRKTAQAAPSANLRTSSRPGAAPSVGDDPHRDHRGRGFFFTGGSFLDRPLVEHLYLSNLRAMYKVYEKCSIFCCLYMAT